jgi:ATP-dependent DNA helicase PIF1
MRDLGVPVKEIKAQHTGTGAATADWERGGNLHKSLPLCLGARVMLTENSWTERGLVNGALGTIKGFHWQEGTDIERSVPTILIAFDNYDGPLLEDFEGGICAVPVAPSKREFTINNIACTRIQVPLTIAWAITVHKAQGITADKIVTNIVEKDHVIGLTYVAVSRVKKLTGLLFEEPFDYSRFRSTRASKTETMRLTDYARRSLQHIPITVPELD